MPMYEYECRACRHRFEVLILPPVTSAEIATCPSCQSHDLERVPSRLSVSSETSRQRHVNHARKLASKEAREKEHADIEAVAHHRD